jgi:hypothetical protein
MIVLSNWAEKRPWCAKHLSSMPEPELVRENGLVQIRINFASSEDCALYFKKWHG